MTGNGRGRLDGQKPFLVGINYASEHSEHARTNLSAEASLVRLTDVLVAASAGGVRR